MPRSTRKRRGGGLFNLLKASPKQPSPTVSNLAGKRDYNLRHSKSRVANIMTIPGTVKYTEKERIEQDFQDALRDLKTIENPNQTASALQTLSSKMKDALTSQTARETGAIMITVPVGVAQLFVKVARLFATILILMVGLPSSVLVGNTVLEMASSVAPNTAFNTTKRAYATAKEMTGVIQSPSTNVY